jgi:hypothetical protein
MYSSLPVHLYSKIVEMGYNKKREFLISDFRRVLYIVCFLLGISPASEFYMPTFRNTVYSIFIGKYVIYLLAYEYETDRVFRNVGI